MTLYKCDRCSRDIADKAGVLFVDVLSSGHALGKYELCSTCLLELENFFRPLPVAAVQP